MDQPKFQSPEIKLNYKTSQVLIGDLCDEDLSATDHIENPIAKVINEFVEKRQNYINRTKPELDQRYNQIRSQIEILEASESHSEITDLLNKPKLEEFLAEFEEKIHEVNQTYKLTKEQFQMDMKTFKDKDIYEEEQIIEKSINEGAY